MYKSPISLIALISLSGCVCPVPLVEEEPTIGLSRFTSCQAMNQHHRLSDTGFVMVALFGAMWPSRWIPQKAAHLNHHQSHTQPPTFKKWGWTSPIWSKPMSTFTRDEGGLSIVQSWPAEDTTKVGELAFEHRPDRMFLSQDRVLLYSSLGEYKTMVSGVPVPGSMSSMSPTEPPPYHCHQTIDGALVSAHDWRRRLHGGQSIHRTARFGIRGHLDGNG